VVAVPLTAMVAVWPDENSFSSSFAGRSSGAPAAGAAGAAGALAVLPALLLVAAAAPAVGAAGLSWLTKGSARWAWALAAVAGSFCASLMSSSSTYLQSWGQDQGAMRS